MSYETHWVAQETIQAYGTGTKRIAHTRGHDFGCRMLNWEDLDVDVSYNMHEEHIVTEDEESELKHEREQTTEYHTQEFMAHSEVQAVID